MIDLTSQNRPMAVASQIAIGFVAVAISLERRSAKEEDEVCIHGLG
jgi:hypothetical protein